MDNPNLTFEQVQQLSEGTEVEIKFQYGSEFRRFTIVVLRNGERVAQNPYYSFLRYEIDKFDQVRMVNDGKN